MREQRLPLILFKGAFFLKQARIRSIHDGKHSAWIYIQDISTQEEAKPATIQIKAAALPVESRINQYGRFRYSEMQYGEMIEKINGISLKVNSTPVRIRSLKGQWIYSHQTTINGACPAIRIRSRYGNKDGPWVYIQQQEV